MKCPRCECEMEIQNKDGIENSIEIDVCSKCGGTWLDASELKHLDDNFFVNLEEISYKDVEPTDTDSEVHCPRCDGSPVLRKVTPPEFPDVVIDTCPTCSGFWLDKGEMDKLREVSDKLLISSLIMDE